MSLIEKIKSLFLGIDNKLENNYILFSIRQGLTLMIPILLIGSFALIIISFPIQSYQDYMEFCFGEKWKELFLGIREGSFGIMSLIMVMSVSYSYANEHSKRYTININPIITAIISLCSFVALSGFGRRDFLVSNFGVTGMFFAIIVAVTSSAIFVKLCSFKFLQIKAFTDGASYTFNDAVSSIFPASITIIFFVALYQLVTSILGITDINNFISSALYIMFLKVGYSLFSAILFIFLIHFFWFFGMHGSNILEPIAQSIFVPALSINIALINKGNLPTEIFTKTFFDTFILMGGCGSILCLVCAIMITAKYKNLRRHAKLSIFPVLFNINELMVFGIPIVFNTIYLIPFIFIPILLTLTSYIAMLSGLVPYTTHLVEWTTPIFLSGYTATHSLNGSLLQLFNLAIGTLLYIPFVKIAEKKTAKQMKNNLKKVYSIYELKEKNSSLLPLTARYDDVGKTSRFLVADFENDLKKNKFKLLYQPQVDYEKNIFGIEALFRWNHNIYGYIPPPLTVTLAEESLLIDRLGYWIFETACRDYKELEENGIHGITLSINFSALQLENDHLINNLKEIIGKYHIEPQLLKIEITEKDALSGSPNVIKHLNDIKNLGLKLAMDDFGMGHSSLMYLKEYKFDTIKIDGSLVKEILTNNTCCDIISSIVFLSKSIDFSIIAEYVETVEQRNKLHQLGCNQYQGYLYSKAISLSELIALIRNLK